MTATLISATIEIMIDTDPALDYLGEYSADPGPDDRTVDRKKRGDQRRNEYRYFISETADYVEENYRRMERFQRGDLVSYGIRAKARVKAQITETWSSTQTLRSGGLWGIESDAGSEYFNEIASEELCELIDILEQFGVEYDTPLEAEWAADAPVSGTVTTERNHD